MQRSCRGMGDGTPEEETNATRETRTGDQVQVNRDAREGQARPVGVVGKVHSTVEAG